MHMICLLDIKSADLAHMGILPSVTRHCSAFNARGPGYEH